MPIVTHEILDELKGKKKLRGRRNKAKFHEQRKLEREREKRTRPLLCGRVAHGTLGSFKNVSHPPRETHPHVKM